MTDAYLAHERLPPGDDGDETVFREADDRLANRSPAHAELAHHIVLADRRARRHLQRDDPVTEEQVRPLRKRRSGGNVVPERYLAALHVNR